MEHMRSTWACDRINSSRLIKEHEDHMVSKHLFEEHTYCDNCQCRGWFF